MILINLNIACKINSGWLKRLTGASFVTYGSIDKGYDRNIL